MESASTMLTHMRRLPHRGYPLGTLYHSVSFLSFFLSGDELSSTKVSTWMECRAVCEALSDEAKTSSLTDQTSSSSSSPQPPVVSLRGPCTHWTFGPTSSLSSPPSSSSSLAYTTYQPAPGVSDCRTFTGGYTLASLSVVPGTVTETIKCPARTLLDDPRQWSATSIFEDLTDSVCPLIGPGISAKAMRASRPFARELCLLDLSGTYGLSTSAKRQEQRFLFSSRPSMTSTSEEGGGNKNHSSSSSSLSSLPRGLQVSKKLIRVYFAPSSPLFFIDGIRRGQRHFGPADLTAGMNRLTIPWVQWHLDRQAFLENNLSAMTIVNDSKTTAASMLMNSFFKPFTPSRGGRGPGSALPPSRSLSAVRDGPVTRPVNALMLMRYDNLDSRTPYDRGAGPGGVYMPRGSLNYFEIIMHLNPLPPSAAAALAMESELADFSAEVRSKRNKNNDKERKTKHTEKKFISSTSHAEEGPEDRYRLATCSLSSVLLRSSYQFLHGSC